MANNYWKFVNKLSDNVESALTSVLNAATSAVDARTAGLKESLDSTMAAMAGRQISDARADEFEKLLQTNPDNLKIRIVLLGKYGDSQFTANSPYRIRRIEHIAWIVENHPECSIAGSPFAGIEANDDVYKAAYLRVKQLWLEQCNKSDVSVAVLTNAAHFFMQSHKKLAEKCLNKALKLQPRNKEVRALLGFLYSLWDGHEAEALKNLETAIDLGWTDFDRFNLLEKLPEAAFAAGRFEKASKAADRVLVLAKFFRDKNLDTCGDAINAAHTVLGRLALKKGNIKSAKFHLALSIIGAESPVNCSFGASLDLAKELLDTGENDDVLKYLDAHERLCGPDHERAFELRYKAQFGKERQYPWDEEFDQAFLDHQIDVYRTHPQSPDDIDGSIKTTQNQIDTWSRRYDEANQSDNFELAYHANKRRQMYEAHLTNLKSL